MAADDDAPQQAPQAAYDMALWQLGEQVQANHSFDTKAGAVRTVAAAFAGIFAASLFGAFGDGPPRPAAVAVVLCGAAVFAVFGWTLFAFYRTVRPARLAHGPEPSELVEVAARHGETAVRLWIAGMLAESIAANAEATQEKATWFRRELRGAVVQGGATILGLLLVALARLSG